MTCRFSSQVNTQSVTPALKTMIKRFSAIESTMAHMKMDSRVALNSLKGALRDTFYAGICVASRNIRLLLKNLQVCILSTDLIVDNL